MLRNDYEYSRELSKDWKEHLGLLRAEVEPASFLIRYRSILGNASLMLLVQLVVVIIIMSIQISLHLAPGQTESPNTSTVENVTTLGLAIVEFILITWHMRQIRVVDNFYLHDESRLFVVSLVAGAIWICSLIIPKVIDFDFIWVRLLSFVFAMCICAFCYFETTCVIKLIDVDIEAKLSTHSSVAVLNLVDVLQTQEDFEAVMRFCTKDTLDFLLMIINSPLSVLQQFPIHVRFAEQFSLLDPVITRLEMVYGYDKYLIASARYRETCSREPVRFILANEFSQESLKTAVSQASGNVTVLDIPTDADISKSNIMGIARIEVDLVALECIKVNPQKIESGKIQILIVLPQKTKNSSDQLMLNKVVLKEMTFEELMGQKYETKKIVVDLYDNEELGMFHPIYIDQARYELMPLKLAIHPSTQYAVTISRIEAQITHVMRRLVDTAPMQRERVARRAYSQQNPDMQKVINDGLFCNALHILCGIDDADSKIFRLLLELEGVDPDQDQDGYNSYFTERLYNAHLCSGIQIYAQRTASDFQVTLLDDSSFVKALKQTLHPNFKTNGKEFGLIQSADNNADTRLWRWAVFVEKTSSAKHKGHFRMVGDDEQDINVEHFQLISLIVQDPEIVSHLNEGDIAITFAEQTYIFNCVNNDGDVFIMIKHPVHAVYFPDANHDSCAWMWYDDVERCFQPFWPDSLLYSEFNASYCANAFGMQPLFPCCDLPRLSALQREPFCMQFTQAGGEFTV